MHVITYKELREEYCKNCEGNMESEETKVLFFNSLQDVLYLHSIHQPEKGDVCFYQTPLQVDKPLNNYIFVCNF